MWIFRRAIHVITCNKHDDVYFVLLEEDEEEEEEVRGKMLPFDRLIIPGKLKIFLQGHI